MLPSLTGKAETPSQRTSRERSSDHGSLRPILPSTITLLAVLNMMELQRGLSEVQYSKNGRQTVPYCGSVEIVRFSYSLGLHGY
jgi:hypothetical protein